jgi:hypothetical protein
MSIIVGLCLVYATIHVVAFNELCLGVNKPVKVAATPIHEL